MFRLAFVVLLQLVTFGQSSEDWCYSDAACEPYTWSLHYSDCGQNAQSPINIDTKNVFLDSTLRVIEITAASGSSQAYMNNNGHSVEVTLSSEYFLNGAGLSYPHTLAGFHIHFGNKLTDKVGSEHSINGKVFPMEVHFVFYNTMYPNLTTAKAQPDGLAVVGILFKIGYHNHALNTFIQKLHQVQYKGQSTSLSLDLGSIVPLNFKYYYTYKGSLTTPPCSENVAWHILQTIPMLSWQQYQAIVSSLYFTTVNSIHPEPMENNFRPVQPLNGRKISRPKY